jgi:hypothetical protein
MQYQGQTVNLDGKVAYLFLRPGLAQLPVLVFGMKLYLTNLPTLKFRWEKVRIYGGLLY